ncbi:general stress protein [Singulisphaera sp. Ch08]|uniref:General stress protein n=1 Tax=Singulisphaera sp. Ch08 TaxID=3120278 RepID=A0AAU7CR39_9BACT
MKNVVGMFESRTDAESAIHRLKLIGIGMDSVSIAMRDRQEASELVMTTGAEDMSGEGATAGVVSGAAVGTLVGLALVGSTFVLPGIGTFLIGGPLAAALAGAGIGAASGGLLGALIGAGIPETEAQHYSSGIEEGHILVSTQVSDDLAPAVARIFDEEGSKRTHTA